MNLLSLSQNNIYELFETSKSLNLSKSNKASCFANLKFCLFETFETFDLKKYKINKESYAAQVKNV